MVFTPVISEKKAIDCTPDVAEFPLKTMDVTFNIKGSPPEFANALARVGACEREYYAIQISSESVHTNDQHIVLVELIDNIRFLPLRHGLTDEDIDRTVMRIDITNNDNNIKAITFEDVLYQNHKPSPPITFPNIILIYLEPKMRLQVEEFRIVRGTGLDIGQHDHIATRFFPGAHHVAWPLTQKTESMMVATIMEYNVRFGLKGVVAVSDRIVDEVMSASCSEIIARLELLLKLVIDRDAQTMVILDTLCTLKTNETNTIAKVLDRVAVEYFTDIENVVSIVQYPSMDFKFEVKHHDAYKTMISIFNITIELFKSIKSQFS